MKVYVGKDRVLLQGKAWEIRYQLKEYSNHYQYVRDWVNDHRSNGTTIRRLK